jgi:hypothetical protein
MLVNFGAGYSAEHPFDGLAQLWPRNHGVAQRATATPDDHSAVIFVDHLGYPPQRIQLSRAGAGAVSKITASWWNFRGQPHTHVLQQSREPFGRDFGL